MMLDADGEDDGGDDKAEGVGTSGRVGGGMRLVTPFLRHDGPSAAKATLP